MFTRPGVEPTPANRSDSRKSSTAVSDSNVYTPPKVPSARSASQIFEASPGTAAKAGASSSHERANSSSESPSRLNFTIRICMAISSARAGGPQDDDDVTPRCADEDLMRIGVVLTYYANGVNSRSQLGRHDACGLTHMRAGLVLDLVSRHRPSPARPPHHAKSLAILRQRCIDSKGRSWVADGHDFLAQWLEDPG